MREEGKEGRKAGRHLKSKAGGRGINTCMSGMHYECVVLLIITSRRNTVRRSYQIAFPAVASNSNMLIFNILSNTVF